MKSPLAATLFALTLLSGCSGDTAGDEAAEGGVAGPYPATITGTICSSWPLDDGSGRIRLDLCELENAGVLVSEATYDAKGMEEDDVEFDLSVSPIDAAECGDDVAACYEGS